ncbi:hypothetical protein [Prochlorococcus sp. MIT 1307]|uniref:hypothetical protein n=1 Tax=Prochlorococcus sp. MIT 1307 TaxID=3096219 RepID=UPI002A757C6B|nr:hypothetical protein [Prochlorococcus sp. MIT 1307]
MELEMRIFETAFLKAVVFAALSVGLIFSCLFGGWKSVEALSNPLAGKPLGFDEMLPYMSKEQPIYRSGTGDNGENSLGIVIEPSDESEDLSGTKEEMSMEDIFGSEQIFPFEPGLGNGGRT